MALTIDGFASRRHYANHLYPIWRALPEHRRGVFYVTSSLAAEATAASISVAQGRVPTRPNIPILVSAYSDLRIAPHRRVVFTEHGSGQYYDTDDPSYSGGPGRERVDLFICPNPRVAARNLARYPTSHAVAVGCPRLDQWHPPVPKPPSSPPVIAVTWHADIRVAPETRPGIREFSPMLPLLQAAGYRLLGHGHPRIFSRLRRLYDRHGIESVADPDEVFRRADVLIADNTSFAFEFASLGRPVVFCSPSFYRHDFHAPPRFWDATEVYPHASTPEEVPAAVAAALTPPSSELAAARDSFIRSVYHHLDGRSSARAAAAIVAYLEGRLEDLDALDRDPDDGSVARPVDLDLRPSP